MDSEGKKKLSDHELLIKTVTILERVEKGFNNHLEHHRKHDTVMLAVTLGAIFTAMVSILSTILAIIRG